MKIVHALLAVMFLIFAGLQINDPDPYIWIPIYGAMTVICIMAFYGRYNTKLMVALIVLYAAYSIFFIPGVKVWMGQEDKNKLFDNVAKMEHPFIEESREFLGLLINIVVLVVYLFISRKKK